MASSVGAIVFLWIILTETGKVSFADAGFTEIYSTSAYSEFGADFRLYHAVHVAVQDCKFQRGQMQFFDKFIIFGIIRLLVFKTIDGIHWQCLIIRKVYGFDDRSPPVRSCSQRVNEMVYFSITGKFYGDLLAFAVFAVNLRYLSSGELIQEADSGLGYIVTIRYDISDFVHMVQVFDEPDIAFVSHPYIVFFDGAQSLQSDHFAHEPDVFPAEIGSENNSDSFAYFPFENFVTNISMTETSENLILPFSGKKRGSIGR